MSSGNFRVGSDFKSVVLSEDTEEQQLDSDDSDENDEIEVESEVDGVDDEDGGDDGLDGQDTEDGDEDVSEDEIEELEFEDENEVEDEEDEIVGADSEQEVELRSVDGRIFVKIKTKTRRGEFEEEIEASGSANIASLKLKIKDEEVDLKIESRDGNILLVQEVENGERVASTNLQMLINSTTNTISIQTESGTFELLKFPAEIMNTLLSSESLENVEKLELKENFEGGVTRIVYHAEGSDSVKLLGLFTVNAPIGVDIDSQSGQELLVSEPWYLKYLSFLFSD